MASTQERIEQLRGRSRRPMRPGQFLAGLLDEMGITQTELAARLGITRATLSRFVQGRRPLTPDMAQRLGRFFGDGPGVWMQMQAMVDLWDALHMDATPYAAIEPWQEQQAA